MTTTYKPVQRNSSRSSLIEECQRDPLLTPIEVGKAFGVDPKTVTRWAKDLRFGDQGEGYIRTLGGHRRYRQSWVNQMLVDGKRPMIAVKVQFPEIED